MCVLSVVIMHIILKARNLGGGGAMMQSLRGSEAPIDRVDHGIWALDERYDYNVGNLVTLWFPCHQIIPTELNCIIQLPL